MELFLVGGAVRDMVMGRVSKDWDFTVVGPSSFPEFQAELAAAGFEEFTSDEAHGTVRAHAPKGFSFAGMVPPVKTFDFVLARRDVSTDGRRAVTETGTLADDLARRDFTMNAIAIDADGVFIDPHNGRSDIAHKLIRTVGMPKTRFNEDGLRVLRAIRFAVTLDFEIEGVLGIELTMRGAWHATRPEVSVERRREELLRAFRCSTIRTLRELDHFGMLDIIDADGLWLKPTLEQR